MEKNLRGFHVFSRGFGGDGEDCEVGRGGAVVYVGRGGGGRSIGDGGSGPQTTSEEMMICGGAGGERSQHRFRRDDAWFGREKGAVT